MQRIEPVYQSEASECALACLCMIMNANGHDVDLAYLRQKHALSQRGATIKDILRISSDVGLIGRALKFELEYLNQLESPCILHWGLMHFVVLERITRDGAIIVDPAIGRRKVTKKQLNDCVTGIAVQFQPTKDMPRQQGRKQLSVREFLADSLSFRKAIWVILAAAFVHEVLLLLIPFYLQIVVDLVIEGGNSEALPFVFGVFVGVLVLVAISQVVRSFLGIRLGRSISLEWQLFAYRRVLSLPLDYFVKRNLGDISSRVRGIEQIQRTVTVDFADAILEALFSIIIAAVLFVYSPLMGSVTLFAVLVAILVRLVWTAKIVSHIQGYEINAAKQNNFFFETVRSIIPIKLFGGESNRLSHWFTSVSKTQKHHVERERARAKLEAVTSVLMDFERLAVVGIGAWLALDGRLTLGMLLAYVIYRELLVSRLISFLSKTTELKSIGVQVGRLSDIVAAEPEEKGPIEFPDVPGGFEIEFVDVWFQYSVSDPWVVKGLSLKIPSDNTVLFHGPSGAGKSTLLGLASGLLRPSRGEVLVNGKPIQHVNRNSFRNKIVCVMQDEMLFEGTILDNIALFEDSCDHEAVKDAAKKACIHDFIEALPMGYMTFVSGLQAGFSGGQRQRIILARVFYFSPRLVVLDEYSSNLDPEVERSINKAIDQLEATKLIVSHREATRELADILVDMTSESFSQ